MFAAILIGLCLERDLLACYVLKDYRPICSNTIRMDGPAVADRVVGRIRIYRIREGWSKLVTRLRRKLKGQPSYSEHPKDTDMLYFFGGADLRLDWGRVSAPAIGLYRDFRAQTQRVPDVYGASWKLKGKRATGWITVLAFDGRIEDRRRIGELP
jgi:hypothetical protein